MSEYRPREEVAQAFGAVARALDDAVASVRPELERRQIAVEDRSNRTGFDWMSLDYSWSHLFRREGSRDACVVLTEVHLTYREPEIRSELPAPVDCRISAEVFRPGQLSLFAQATTRRLPLPACGADTLLPLLDAGLREAAATLPAHYREALNDAGSSPAGPLDRAT